MSMFEKPVSSVDHVVSAKSNNNVEIERERYFREIILSKLFNSTKDSLEDADFLPEEVDLFVATFAQFDEADRKSVLSIPFELRDSVYRRYHEQVENGEMSVPDVAQDILEKNKRHGFTLGYHITNAKIQKKREGDRIVWNVNGTELDDRDDRPMAYYSEDYMNRYTKKRGRYLYVVRAETGPTSTHKIDLNNHWGRASILSIIDEYDMQEIEGKIDSRIKEEAASETEAA